LTNALRVVPRLEQKYRYILQTGKIRLLAKTSNTEDEALEYWVREQKWGTNQSRTLDYLMTDPVLATTSNAVGEGTQHESGTGAVVNTVIQDSAYDRMLYKGALVVIKGEEEAHFAAHTRPAELARIRTKIRSITEFQSNTECHDSKGEDVGGTAVGDMVGRSTQVIERCRQESPAVQEHKSSESNR